MEYRLGLDVGSTSIGWAMLELKNGEPVGILDMGVRIFSDGRDDKSKEPLSVTRRTARGIRRNRDRYKVRRADLLACLKENGLLPQSKEKNNKLIQQCPYALRAKAVEEKISLHELGRALFHIDQRRGFKSNRKTDGDARKESNMQKAIDELGAILKSKGGITLGTYLYKERIEKGEPARVTTTKKGSKNLYDIYPTRAMYEREFDTIWDIQSQYHEKLKDADLKEKIRNIIFYQRPLKKQEVGYCLFEYENEKRRAALALPSVQRFRIYQEVNNLEFEKFKTDEQLSPENKETIREMLLKGKLSKKERYEIKFDKIRKQLKLSDEYTFNLEDEKRKGLKGDKTSAIMASKDYFGSQWWTFAEEKQDEIISRLISEEGDEAVQKWLCSEFKLDKTVAKNIMNAPLDDGYGNVSLEAINKIMPFLKKDGCTYDKAVKKAGYNHSEQGKGEGQYDTLEYYGTLLPEKMIGGSKDKHDLDKAMEAKEKGKKDEEQQLLEKYYGKINNPTVHVGLNQIRRVINKLIETHGKPSQIVIELARDFVVGTEKRAEIIKEQSNNQTENENIAKALRERGITNNYDNRMKYKLWTDLAKEPQDRCCPFTGKSIGISDLFSYKIEVEHLLPHRDTYDDSRANKVVCFIEANRDKQKRTPYAAFAHSTEYNWEEILVRAAKLPKNKRWRFEKDAMEKFREHNKIIARMLPDTMYMAKVAREYLAFICHPNSIWSVPGKLTSMLRDEWGLNSVIQEVSNAAYKDALSEEKLMNAFGKNKEEAQKKKVKKDRSTHYHHAIDALVLACTSRSLLQRLSGEVEDTDENLEKYAVPDAIKGMDEGAFRKAVRECLQGVIISHKPDHKDIPALRNHGGTSGQLHKETAYGYIAEGEKKDHIVVATRRDLFSLEKESDIEKIADDKIREDLQNGFYHSEGKNEWQQFLQDYSQTHNIKRVRVHIEKSRDSFVPIHDKEGKVYKYYEARGNFCMEIYCLMFGKEAGKWQSEIIRTYDAHQPDFQSQWRKDYPTAKLIMRLMINDMVAYEEEGKTIICRVKKMSGKRVCLRPHFIGKEEGDSLTWTASPSEMQKKNARKISVDEIGQIKDRGAIPPINTAKASDTEKETVNA